MRDPLSLLTPSLLTLPLLLAACSVGEPTPQASTAAVTLAAAARTQQSVPLMGTVIRSKRSPAVILAPSDSGGEVRLTGLAPGMYSVQPFEGARDMPMEVGPDSQLAFAVWEDAAPRPTLRSKPPVASRWAEQIPFQTDRADAVVLPPPIPGDVLDVNTAGPDDWKRTTYTTPQAGGIIMAERERNGPFTDMIDFAERVCSQTGVDFLDNSVQFGDQLMLLKRGGDPKQAGFKCAQGTGEVELFGRAYGVGGLALFFLK